MTESERARGGSSFRDLRVWQEARALAIAVHRLADGLPAREQHSSADQMRRAAGSVHANIAEGSGRRTPADFGRFLTIAWASLRELDAHLDVAHGIGLLSDDELAEVQVRIRRVGQLLSALRRHLR